MKTILFTDLDDTLFASSRKQQPTAHFTLATTLRDGSPSAYLSPKQQQFWQLWQKNGALIVPVTARNRETFSRVRLPFNTWAILNHGATILTPDAQCDLNWHTRQSAHALHTRAWLRQQYQRLQQLADAQNTAVRLRINQDDGLDLYVLLKAQSADETAVARLAADYRTRYHAPEDGYIHCNGNNLAILPYWLGKAPAVACLQAYLRAQYGEILSIGCGDSHSDLAFMRLCDYWLTPSRSQIDQQLFI